MLRSILKGLPWIALVALCIVACTAGEKPSKDEIYIAIYKYIV